MAQSSDSMTVDSTLGVEDESNNHMDLDTPDASLMLSGPGATVAGFGPEGDENYQMVCYGMVSKCPAQFELGKPY